MSDSEDQETKTTRPTPEPKRRKVSAKSKNKRPSAEETKKVIKISSSGLVMHDGDKAHIQY